MTKCIWRKTTVTTLPKPHWCLRGGPQVRTCLSSPHYLPHVNEYEKQCEKEEEFDDWLALPFYLPSDADKKYTWDLQKNDNLVMPGTSLTIPLMIPSAISVHCVGRGHPNRHFWTQASTQVHVSHDS